MIEQSLYCITVSYTVGTEKLTVRKKTLLRTIRVSEEIDKLLQEDARAKRTSVNALVSAMMTRYAEWDRYTDRFGVISLSTDLFRAIIDASSEKELIRIAEELGARLPREMMLFWYRKFNLDSFLRYIASNARYARLGEYELENNEGDYALSIHHGFGEKWSKFLSAYLGQTLQAGLELTPRFELTKNSLIISFKTFQK